jgi:glycosyltransferase involved in cell wall biosynthesis
MQPPDSDRPLSILHLTLASDAGGLSRYIFDLCSAMHALGHQVAVAGDRGAWHSLFESAPFPWIDVPFKSGLIGIRQCDRILESYLEKNPVDVLHVHYRRCTVVARRIQRRHSIPILYTLHLTHIAMGLIRRRFTDFGDHTHAASKDARAWLEQSAGILPDRITVIPHGVKPDLFSMPGEQSRADARAALGLRISDVVAVFVGRLDVPKNEGWMLDLAAESREKLPALKVILVGEGPHEAQLRSRIQRENLEDRVMLLGRRDPLMVYHAADALLLPSAREGFSLVCAEAMCTGLPVLRTRTAGTSELVIENVTGQSVPIDHDAFIAAAIEFLADVPALKRLGQTAAKHVRDHFTFDRQLSETIALYRSLL